MKLTVTTREAASLFGKDPRSVHRWATALGVQPVRTMRIGRSTITVWSVADLRNALRRAYAGQTQAPRGEMTMLPVECPTSGQTEVA